MIISCPNCKKKFEVLDNLIPEGGRLLQLGHEMIMINYIADF